MQQGGDGRRDFIGVLPLQALAEPRDNGLAHIVERGLWTGAGAAGDYQRRGDDGDDFKFHVGRSMMVQAGNMQSEDQRQQSDDVVADDPRPAGWPAVKNDLRNDARL